MNKGLIFFWLLAVGLFSCKSDEDLSGGQAGVKVSLEEYFKTYGITDIDTTDSNLYYTIIEPGEGELPVAGDVVKVRYNGYLTNNQLFDSSYGRDAFSFVIGKGEVIAGWDEGIALFRKGGSGVLFIPSALAYGDQGRGGFIEPGDDLIFEVLLEDLIPDLSRIDIAYYIQANKLERYLSTDSGIFYEIIGTPEGTSPVVGQTVTIDYVGYFLNDEIFDSTINKGQTFTFVVGSEDVLAGLSEAVTLLKPGVKGEFLIPSELAYGTEGTTVVAPNQDLRYTVTLISID